MYYDIAHATGVLEPRKHDYSADTWRALPDDEREQFHDQYQRAIEESDLPEHVKQAKMIQLGGFGGLTLSSAFERYVNGVEQWYA